MHNVNQFKRLLTFGETYCQEYTIAFCFLFHKYYLKKGVYITSTYKCVINIVAVTTIGRNLLLICR